jgi:hypothetical protein
MTIDAFLEARITEDEAEARWVADEGDHGSSYVQHPDRILAECKAKRALIETYADEHGSLSCLIPLASVYSDHPDYNPQWSL